LIETEKTYTLIGVMICGNTKIELKTYTLDWLLQLFVLSDPGSVCLIVHWKASVSPPTIPIHT